MNKGFLKEEKFLESEGKLLSLYDYDENDYHSSLTHPIYQYITIQSHHSIPLYLSLSLNTTNGDDINDDSDFVLIIINGVTLSHIIMSHMSKIDDRQM